ncbi:MAG: hypothetical protein II371_08075, partial [Flavobacteriales bacterium]|nr:hypothetical protein [Flavobacteriales bacterium]
GVRAGNEIAKHFAGDNVDVIIYAVEKSLDGYKFNLLHCKQTFITQLKSGAMGARTGVAAVCVGKRLYDISWVEKTGVDDTFGWCDRTSLGCFF